MHDDLYAYLTGTSAITDIFGARIFAEYVPQDNAIWPALVFQLASETEVAEDMAGPTAPKIDAARWQFDVYSNSMAGANTAANTFDAIFRLARGTMGTVNVQAASRENRAERGEVVGDKQRRRVTIDYVITYQ
jgi:hypothetical protein